MNKILSDKTKYKSFVRRIKKKSIINVTREKKEIIK